jgi:hypothetical protein
MLMATVGRLVELLREESAAAKEAGEQGIGVKLYELAEEPGGLSDEQEAWVAQASDEDLRRYVREVRRGEWS